MSRSGSSASSWPQRAVAIAVVALVVGLAVLVALRVRDLLDRPPSHQTVRARGAGELTVDEAFQRRPDKAVVVRGYVFAGDGFPVRLCNGIERTSPAHCVGPYLELSGLDPSRVPVTSKKSGGRTVVWSTEPVAVLGTVTADRLAVTELVN